MSTPSKHKTFNIGEQAIAQLGLSLWAVFTLVYFFLDSMLIKAVLGFPLLVVLPGLFFLLSIQYKKNLDWLYLCAAVGSSLTIIMVFGLVINFVFPVLGIVPLVGNTLVFSFFIVLLLLSVVPMRRGLLVHYEITSGHRINSILLGISAIPVLLSVVGALRINNQLGAEVALFSLYFICALFILTVVYQKYLRESVLCGIIYLQSLALLLMTSLRGWDIVGHDILREFSVFQMTHRAGVWSIDYLLDAYNACLSITILPTVFAELLSVSDVYVYKLLFQIIFALVPVVSFIVISRYFPKHIAILATFLIVAFPTFFTDMPMLNRQEIAFLMFMLQISVLFDSAFSERARFFLTIFFGIGIILSHYSTTYIIIFFLLAAWIGYWFLRLSLRFSSIQLLEKKQKFFNKTYELLDRPRISFFALVIIILLSFGWSNQFTRTSDDSIKRVLLRTYDAVLKDSESSKSTDVRYSLFSSVKLTPEEVISAYKTDFVNKVRQKAPEGTFYSESDISDFVPKIQEEAKLPLTALGKRIESLGIDVTSLNQMLKFGSAKVLQLFLLLGMILSLFVVKFYVKKPPIEYFLLGVAGVIFLAAMVVIPVFSVEYGVLRAFQQSLFIMAPFAVMGMLGATLLLGEKFAKIFAVTFLLLFFFASSGIATQTFGGYKALLHLNNSGPYYDYYYVHESEVHGLRWLNEQAEKSEQSNFQSEVQTDRYVSKKINERSKVQSVNEIFPALIRKNSFVFLGYANVRNGNATIYYNGMNLSFEYPRDLVHEYKNKVYESEGVIVYR